MSVRDDEIFWDIVEEESWEPVPVSEEIALWLGITLLVPVSVSAWMFVLNWLF